jgi:hypothetical protein
MTQVPAWLTKSLDLGTNHAFSSIDRLEGVGWVVTVLAIAEAGEAEIVVWAVFAGHKLDSSKLCCSISKSHAIRNGFPTVDAAVAGSFTFILNDGYRGFGWSRLGRLNTTGRTIFGDAGHDEAIVNRSLDEPVVVTIASNAGVKARTAQIEISLLADAAVEVFIRDGLATMIAVNAEGAMREVME